MGQPHPSSLASELRQKYDRAAGSYSRRFADPDAVAARQLDLISRWGTSLAPGATVLEVGCGDGFSTVGLARAGLRVTAFDLSPRMAAVTKQRLNDAGVSGDVFACDLNHFESRGTFDAVAAFTGAFFTYVENPRETLRRLADATRGKLLIDLSPRSVAVADAMRLVRDAGFSNVEWRAFLVPTRFRIPSAARPLLRSLERAPLITPLILRRKFRVVIKGEK